MVKKDIKKLASEIERLDNKKEKLNDMFYKILWKEIKPYTHKLEDIPKAVRILNEYYYTGATFDLFSKLRHIKLKLKTKQLK